MALGIVDEVTVKNTEGCYNCITKVFRFHSGGFLVKTNFVVKLLVSLK